MLPIYMFGWGTMAIVNAATKTLVLLFLGLHGLSSEADELKLRSVSGGTTILGDVRGVFRSFAHHVSVRIFVRPGDASLTV